MKFVSLYIYRSKPRQFLIIQITDQTFTIALAQKGDKQLHLLHHQVHALTMNEIKGPIIYNPTAIQQRIQQFIEQHHLTHPKLIVCWPAASTNDIILLQQALCLGKHHIIEKLTTTPLIPETIPATHNAQDECPTWAAMLKAPNVLDALLPKGYHALPTWLTLSGLALGVVLYGLTTMYTTSQHTLNTIATQCTQITAINKDMKTRVKTVHELTQKNQTLDAQIKMVTKHQTYTQTMQDFLITVAQTIPPKSYLVDVAMHNTADKIAVSTKSKAPTQQKASPDKPTRLRLALKGVTYNPEEMGQFLKHLSEKIPNGHFALTNIQRITKTQPSQESAKVPYAFAIRGSIPT